MTTIKTVHRDGSITERELTQSEIDQIAADSANETANAWIELRTERNQRLASCDWTQVADAPVDKYSWAEYRQQLRDLPANTTDPTAPVWPTPPA